MIPVAEVTIIFFFIVFHPFSYPNKDFCLGPKHIISGSDIFFYISKKIEEIYFARNELRH